MAIVINPGSEHRGGTLEVAIKRAEWVLQEQIIKEGITDVVLLRKARKTDTGWAFSLQHQLTGVTVEYDTHGLFTLDESHRDHGYIFCPRDYWNGISNANPKIEDWLADGFAVEHRIVSSAS